MASSRGVSGQQTDIERQLSISAETIRTAQQAEQAAARLMPEPGAPATELFLDGYALLGDSPPVAPPPRGRGLWSDGGRGAQIRALHQLVKASHASNYRLLLLSVVCMHKALAPDGKSSAKYAVLATMSGLTLFERRHRADRAAGRYAWANQHLTAAQASPASTAHADAGPSRPTPPRINEALAARLDAAEAALEALAEPEPRAATTKAASPADTSAPPPPKAKDPHQQALNGILQLVFAMEQPTTAQTAAKMPEDVTATAPQAVPEAHLKHSRVLLSAAGWTADNCPAPLAYNKRIDGIYKRAAQRQLNSNDLRTLIGMLRHRYADAQDCWLVAKDGVQQMCSLLQIVPRLPSRRSHDPGWNRPCRAQLELWTELLDVATQRLWHAPRSDLHREAVENFVHALVPENNSLVLLYPGTNGSRYDTAPRLAYSWAMVALTRRQPLTRWPTPEQPRPTSPRLSPFAPERTRLEQALAAWRNNPYALIALAYHDREPLGFHRWSAIEKWLRSAPKHERQSPAYRSVVKLWNAQWMPAWDPESDPNAAATPAWGVRRASEQQAPEKDDTPATLACTI